MALHISPAEIGSVDFIMERQRHYLRERQSYTKQMADKAAAKAKALLDADLAIRAEKEARRRGRISETKLAKAAEYRGVSVEEVKQSADQARSIHSVISLVAAAFGLTYDELVSIRRTGELIIPRHIAMYLCRKKLLDKSYPQIAHVFKRDHSTIVSGYEKIKELLTHDKEVQARVSEIEGMLS